MRERQGSGLMGAVAATLARQYPICSARAWAPHATLRRVPGAIRTHTVGVLSAATPAIGLRAHGAATRCRPGSPALRGQGRSRARRRGFRGWTRTSGGRGQGPAGDAVAPPGIKAPGSAAVVNRLATCIQGACARRESNPHPPGFETGRSAGWLYPRVVRRQRIELRSSD